MQKVGASQLHPFDRGQACPSWQVRNHVTDAYAREPCAMKIGIGLRLGIRWQPTRRQDDTLAPVDSQRRIVVHAEFWNRGGSWIVSRLMTVYLRQRVIFVR